MSSYGWMIGLGEGLQQVGGMIMDYNKEKVRNQLEVEKEQRQVKRDLDKEQRAEATRLARPASWEPIQQDGQWYEQARNEDGKLIPGVTQPMTTYQVEEHQRKIRAAEIAAKTGELNLNSLEFTVGKQPDKWNMDVEKHRSSMQTDAVQRSTALTRASNSGRSGGDSTSPDAHPLEYADAIIKEHKATFERYGVDDGQDQQRIAELAVKGAAAEGISPTQYLLRYLSNMKK